MASLTGSGLNLESGTTTLRSILGSDVLVIGDISPSSYAGESSEYRDITLPVLSPGQCVYRNCRTSSSSTSRVYLPSGGKYIYVANSSGPISRNAIAVSGGTQIDEVTRSGNYITYCRAY